MQTCINGDGTSMKIKSWSTSGFIRYQQSSLRTPGVARASFDQKWPRSNDHFLQNAAHVPAAACVGSQDPSTATEGTELLLSLSILTSSTCDSQ